MGTAMMWRRHDERNLDARPTIRSGAQLVDVSTQQNRDTSPSIGTLGELSRAQERTGLRAGVTPSQPVRMIYICVDDFGLHVGINEASLHLAGMARVHAVACRVGGPTWPEWGRRLRRLDADGIDIGLQLDLTQHPILARSTFSLGALIARSYARKLDRNQLRAEIRAQLDAFEQIVGHAPAFIGGHRHVHQLPMVCDESLDEIDDRYGAFRPWIRSATRARITASVTYAGWRERLAPWVVEQLGAPRLARLAREGGFPQNRHLLGVYGLEGGPVRYLHLLDAWLRSAAYGDLLICHPGTRPNADAPHGARVDEFNALSSEAFGTLLEDWSVNAWPLSQIIFGNSMPA